MATACRTCSRSGSPGRRRTCPSRRQGGKAAGKQPTSVALFDQGLTQVLETAVTGLLPRQSYVLALVTQPDGSGSVEPLAAFMTNPAGSQIVNAVGPIRQIVQNTDKAQRRYLVIITGTADKLGAPVQVQSSEQQR